MTQAVTPQGGEVAKAPPPPQPGTPEHDAAMAALADKRMGGGEPAADGAAAAKPVKPDHIPDKFWDAEKGVVRVDDLAKSYTEAEKKLGAQPPKAPQVVTPPTVDDAAAAAQKAGLDMAALNAEFAEKGDLTPETRTKLETAGYPKEMVDSYIEGQKALASKYHAAAQEAAGSKENLDTMLDWASKHFTPKEAEVFNKATASGDVEQLKFAVSALKSRYSAAEGEKPQLLTGVNAESGTDVFQSIRELSMAQRDKRYTTDPAYRRQIDAKAARSNI
jgi:hypothetical protein